MSSRVKTSTVVGSGQITNTLTNLHSIVVYDSGTTVRTFNISEVSAVPGRANWNGILTGGPSVDQIIFSPALRYESGVSVSVPVSVALSFIFEQG